MEQTGNRRQSEAEARPLLQLPAEISTKLGRFWISVSDATFHHQSLHAFNNRKHGDLKNLFEDPANVMSVLREPREDAVDEAECGQEKSAEILDRLRSQAYHNRDAFVYTPALATPPNSGIQTPYTTGVKGQVTCAVGTDDEPDPWALPELIDEDDSTSWKEMTSSERLSAIGRNIGKVLCLVGLLYAFICSLGLLGDAFKLLGGKATGAVFRESAVLQNPICGLMIGVLTTVLLQSSSTSTSIVVGLVASEILTVRAAIPVIMGANIGTSMTNTLVAMGHSGRRAEFRRAFAAATVHDMFNWLCVLILLPIEVVTGYLYRLTGLLVETLNLQPGEKPPKLLKALTDPLTKRIIQLDKDVIKGLSLGKYGPDEEVSLVKRTCARWLLYDQAEAHAINFSDPQSVQVQTLCTGSHVFGSVQWSDSVVGVLLLLGALTTLILCLLGVVKILHSALKGQLARTIRRFVNNDLPGVFSVFTPYLALAVGCVMTILVQSSSIVTSALTPLVGVGVLTLERMYPLTLGANVGTTFTSLLAALASGHLDKSLQIAFCHLLFNISGILLFFVVPITRKLPINAAKSLGSITAQYRWVALVYIVAVFFLIPLCIFGLSLVGSWLLLSVLIPTMLLAVFVVLVNVLQERRPLVLPEWLRSWQWLPAPLRSLAPYDSAMNAVLRVFPCTRAAAHAQGGRQSLTEGSTSAQGILKASSARQLLGPDSTAGNSSVDLLNTARSDSTARNVTIAPPDMMPKPV